MNITESEDQAQRRIFLTGRAGNRANTHSLRLCTMQRMKESEVQELGQN